MAANQVEILNEVGVGRCDTRKGEYIDGGQVRDRWAAENGAFKADTDQLAAIGGTGVEGFCRDRSSIGPGDPIRTRQDGSRFADGE